jgi:hypothetical protein
MGLFEDYFEQMRKWEKLFNHPAITEIQRIQNAVQKTMLPQSNYLSQIQKVSELFQSHTIDAIAPKLELYTKPFPFGQTINIIEQSEIMKNNFMQISAFQGQFADIGALFKPTNVLLAAIEDGNVISRAINQSGIFDAIANVSKSMSAMETMNRLSNILPIIEPFNYNVSFSDDGTVIVDDTTVSRDDLFEIAKEFSNSSQESLSIPQKIEKIKRKNWYFFAFILWCIFHSLFLKPIFDKTFDEIRERTGINKIIEKIDIKIWFDEIFPLDKEATEEKGLQNEDEK